MSDPRDHRLLIPVDVLAGQSVPRTIVDAFASIPVVLLGYRELPDQTGTDQARDQYGDRARAELAELRTVFEDAGCDVTSRLAFTHNRLKTFERVAVDESCDAVLLLNPAPVLENGTRRPSERRQRRAHRPTARDGAVGTGDRGHR